MAPSASSVKIGGSGLVEYNTMTGALNGIVLDYALASSLVTITNNNIAATAREILVTLAATAITDHTRWSLDYNTYSVTDSFSNKGLFENLAAWKTNTTQDTHSTFA